MTNWRLLFGLALQGLGFVLRERFHMLAARDWIIEKAAREVAGIYEFDGPSVPPSCVFDCSGISTEAAAVGWIGICTILLGIALIVWSRPIRD